MYKVLFFLNGNTLKNKKIKNVKTTSHGMTNLKEKMKETSALYTILEVYLKPNGIIKAQISVRKALPVMFKWVSWIRTSTMFSQYLKH